MIAMPRPLLVPLLALALLAPAALAHDPPGPVLACEAATARHDYLGHAPPELRPLVRDGNDGCGGAPAYDGDFDHGFGGAVLFVVEVDVQACYGPLSNAHHSNEVRAQDALGFGPVIRVATDHSRFPPEDGPDCGDGYLEPCDFTPPAPCTHPFPMNVIIDTLDSVLYDVFGPGGEGCNVREREAEFHGDPSDPSAPSGGTVPFPPGPDGSYVVTVMHDLNWGTFPVGGHVWTE